MGPLRPLFGLEEQAYVNPQNYGHPKPKIRHLIQKKDKQYDIAHNELIKANPKFIEGGNHLPATDFFSKNSK